MLKILKIGEFRYSNFEIFGDLLEIEGSDFQYAWNFWNQYQLALTTRSDLQIKINGV